MTNTFKVLLTEHPLVIPGVTSSNKLARISRARTYSQYKRMVADEITGRCPFCQIDKEHNRIIAETNHWYAWPCNPPEKHTRFHFLFVPKRHVTSTWGLLPGEIVDLFAIRFSVSTEYKYKSCGMLVRDGDATMSAGTIEHLHVHDMVPDGTGRVESPFYKGREAEKEGLQRAILFEKLRRLSLRLQTDELPILLANANFNKEELILLTDRLK